MMRTIFMKFWYRFRKGSQVARVFFNARVPVGARDHAHFWPKNDNILDVQKNHAYTVLDVLSLKLA